MSDRQLQELRNRLVKWMDELKVEQDRLKLDLAAKNALLPDPADQASQVCDWQLIISRQDSVRASLRQVSEAISQIDAGEYGICCGCGEDIGLKRLMARPSTNLCIGCQEIAEHSGQVRPAGLSYSSRSSDHHHGLY